MTIQDLFAEVEHLSIAEKWRLVNFILQSLEQAQTQIHFEDDNAWREAVRATYGILADDPIECPPQLPLEERKISDSVDAMGYLIGYFEETYGSFANDLLERPPQPPLDIRED
jgi:hypothetical protein